mmetsp:Transcript_5733/g.12607  ORF Transcript_5733/g.12607 Transcript_5733/m.12607 type:complete len:207 (-) Transcript_5733:233-853(-)
MGSHRMTHLFGMSKYPPLICPLFHPLITRMIPCTSSNALRLMQRLEDATHKERIYFPRRNVVESINGLTRKNSIVLLCPARLTSSSLVLEMAEGRIWIQFRKSVLSHDNSWISTWLWKESVSIVSLLVFGYAKNNKSVHGGLFFRRISTSMIAMMKMAVTNILSLFTLTSKSIGEFVFSLNSSKIPMAQFKRLGLQPFHAFQTRRA